MGKSARSMKSQLQAVDKEVIQDYEPPTNKGPVVPLNEAQAHYMQAIRTSPIVIGTGPAGVGKSFVATSMAAEALEAKEISQIILTRPAMEAGERLGFLPGEINEKYAPYLAPFRRALDEKLGRSNVDQLIRSKKIVPYPMAYMRGETFNRAWILLDEAQNVSRTQMKMVLTRIGKHSKLIIDGDLSQTDDPRMDGLQDAISRLKALREVSIVNFGPEDCVRSGIVQKVLQVYGS